MVRISPANVGQGGEGGGRWGQVKLIPVVTIIILSLFRIRLDYI